MRIKYFSLQLVYLLRFQRGSESLGSFRYNFHQEIDRSNTGSMKWDFYGRIFGRDDLLPMWVADADWPAPPEVQEAFLRLTDHGIFGYTVPTPDHDAIVVNWVKRHYDWEIDPEWILYTPGIVPSMNIAVRSFTHPGDEVLLQSPVYYPFYPTITNSGALVLNNPLHFHGDTYTMDLLDLERKILEKRSAIHQPPRVKMLLLCSPHNPVGRVWDKEELLSLGEICQEHDILVVSDEIHCDLILAEKKHYPFSKLFPENSITMIAPSKTFNIPGLQISVMIIPHPKIRSIFQASCAGILKSGNSFALEALKVVYSLCDGWLQEQIQYLKENLTFALKEFQSLPGIKAIVPEGTYLLWFDCRDFIPQSEKLSRFMMEEAKVALDEGSWFGPGGEGFMRLNFATQRSILEEGLRRIRERVLFY